MQHKKILFVSTQLPYPPKSGGTVKSWNFVKHLAKNNDLSLACLLKEENAPYQEELRQLVQLKNYRAIKLIVPRSAINLLKSYFLAPCLNLFRNKSSAMKKAVHDLAKGQDLIIIDHYEVFQYVPENFKGKVVLHTHNAEFMLWKRMAELEANWIKKWVLHLESLRVKKYEKQIFKRADLIFTTPSDMKLYTQEGFAIEKQRITFHLGNDELLNLPDIQFSETENSICFIGTLSWEPNIDGLTWFIKEVWPKIIEVSPSCQLNVLGAEPDPRLIEAAKKTNNISFCGFVKDLDSYLKNTRVYIAPLRFGSGMKVKVLDGFYRGVPSVITTVAAEGLKVQNEKEALVTDEAVEFASYCNRLIEDRQLWENLRTNSRDLAREHYLWKDLFVKMDWEMNELLVNTQLH